MFSCACAICLCQCTCDFTCGDTSAWWDRKVIEPLALHVTWACAEDIWYCGVCVFQPCHQPLVLTIALERVASQITNKRQRDSSIPTTLAWKYLVDYKLFTLFYMEKGKEWEGWHVTKDGASAVSHSSCSCIKFEHMSALCSQNALYDQHHYAYVCEKNIQKIVLRIVPTLLFTNKHFCIICQ